MACHGQDNPDKREIDPISGLAQHYPEMPPIVLVAPPSVLVAPPTAEEPKQQPGSG